MTILEAIQQERKVFFIFVIYSVGIILLWNILDLDDVVVKLQTLELSLWYAALFSLAYIVRGFFYFPSLYFIIAASLLFPFPVSIIAYLAGVFASATLSYTIGHLLQKHGAFPKFNRFVHQDDIKTKIEKYGVRSVFIFHATGISLDIPNYLSGYLEIPFSRFFATIVAANLITACIYFGLFYFGIIDVLEWLAT